MLHAPPWFLACLLIVSACRTHAVRAPEPGPALPTRGATQQVDTVRAATVARRVTAIADAYLQGWQAAYPEIGTQYGIPGARHDRLNDRSAAAERAWRAQEEQWLAALRALDPTPLVGRSEWVTYGVLREQLEASTAMRTCRERLWTVHPMTGVLATYATLARQQPVGTDELRTQALARWRAFPRRWRAGAEGLLCRQPVARCHVRPSTRCWCSSTWMARETSTGRA